ncbi:unnamed protein product [Brachionus calyciflorus]|uniref:Arrestin C-terminal-like domain-containing protein n=1 Tax=Brachionus calyciflorus TaxID=104777 RepID=A0A813MRL9_9BILA|nr:unnamed protein product [Brachionus calyciflorus]
MKFSKSKVDYFQISLERQSYFPGEILRGNILIGVSERFEIKKLSIYLCGKGKVHWSETSNESSTYYDGFENYINLEILILNENSDETVFLEAGESTFPFEINLPYSLPSSYEDEVIDARIRYYIKATIKKRKIFSSIYTETDFYIFNKMDLNLYNFPYVLNKNKYFGFGPFKSGPISIEFSLEKTGYSPGELIPFNVYIHYERKKIIKKVKVRLIKYARFFASNRNKSKILVENSIKYPYSIESDFLSWNDFLMVPQVWQSSNGLSKIVQVNYFVSLEIFFRFFRTTSLMIPVIIGI